MIVWPLLSLTLNIAFFRSSITSPENSRVFSFGIKNILYRNLDLILSACACKFSYSARVIACLPITSIPFLLSVNWLIFL